MFIKGYRVYRHCTGRGEIKWTKISLSVFFGQRF